MTYAEELQQLKLPTLEAIFKIAGKHAGGTDAALQQLCAHGREHADALTATWQRISGAQQLFARKFTLIDWGCGTGLATCSFIESLRRSNIDYFVNKVIPIDKSQQALNLARLHVGCFVGQDKVECLCKDFIDVKPEDIAGSTSHTVHLMADILSDKGVNAEMLGSFLSSYSEGSNTFICTESKSTGSDDVISHFASRFGLNEVKKLDEKQQAGRNKSLHTLVFTAQENHYEIIKKEYYMAGNKKDSVVLKRLLSRIDAKDLSELDKIILFYRTVIELERSKEPDIKNYYPYPINFLNNGKDNVLLIDLPCNKPFLREFSENQTVKYNKDLYVGLNVKVGEKNYQLLNNVVDWKDLKGFLPESQLLPCRITDLTVNSNKVEELQLSPETVDEMEDAIKHVSGFGELKQLVKKYVDEDAVIDDKVYMALSQKNMTLAQTASELSKLNESEVRQNVLLKAMLTDREFSNQLDNISEDELIALSRMDDSQRRVVAQALNNRLTVVTGAPGTGKTQVILNILANAAVRGKSVLVASKNNKAVDNVKERFDEIDGTGYLLRFGSRIFMRETGLPAIENLKQQIQRLDGKHCDYQILNGQFQESVARLRNAKSRLQRGEELKSQIESLKDDALTKKAASEEMANDYSNSIAEMHVLYPGFEIYDDISMQSISTHVKAVKDLHNKMQLRYSGLKKIWHNWFHKQEDAAQLVRLIDGLPYAVKKAVCDRGEVPDDLNQYGSGDDIITQSGKALKVMKDIESYIQSFSSKVAFQTRRKKAAEQAAAQAETKYRSALDEIAAIEQETPLLNNDIDESKTKIGQIGLKYLKAYILAQKQEPLAALTLKDYTSYLPDNMPWRREEQSLFLTKTKVFLSLFKLIAVTSLSVKDAFLMENGLFDLLVIDEASQCDVASALPLILRAKQVVIIGDPLQLKHITSVRPEEENAIKEHIGVWQYPHIKYVEKSLWDFCADAVVKAKNNNMPTMLECHYRCHHDIIGYSNEMFYGRKIANLKVMTDESHMTLPLGIIWKNVRGMQFANDINVNEDEVKECLKLAINIHSQHPELSIGIVTPFKMQAEALNRSIPGNLQDVIEASTVHKFQGDEKDVMIYSLVVTDNSPASKIHWIDDVTPNLVNVAVTRARQALIVVGNADYIMRMSPYSKPLGHLVRYALQRKEMI